MAEFPVALAEALGCSLLTVDPRLSRAPGIRCAVTVVPQYRIATGESFPVAGPSGPDEVVEAG